MHTFSCTYDENYSYLFNDKGGRNGKINKRLTNMGTRSGKYSKSSTHSDKRTFMSRFITGSKMTNTFMNLQKKLDLEEYEYNYNQEMFDEFMECQDECSIRRACEDEEDVE